jgi:4-hydroxybenzoate polyprenyltransferase
MQTAKAGSLFKRRDYTLVTAALLSAPAFWVFAPERSGGSFLTIVALGWIFLIAIYAFNRLTELPEGHGALRQHRLILLLSVVAFFPAVASLPNRTAQLAAASVMLIGFSYSVKLRRSGGTFQLKKVYGLKPTMVAAGYSLQWIAFTGSTRPLILSLLAWQFFDVLVLTTLLDVLDVREDAAAGVQTFAVSHGFRRALAIAFVVNLVCLLAGLGAFVLANSIPLALLLFPRALERHWRLGRLRRGKRAGSLNPTLLRAVGVFGVGLHWGLENRSFVQLY